MNDLGIKEKKLDMDVLQTEFERVEKKRKLAEGDNTEKKPEENETEGIAQTSDKETENSLRKKHISAAQYDIFLKFLEEDKIFRIGMLLKENGEYIAEQWAELSNQLNNCICGPKLPINEWRQRLTYWKCCIKRKSQNLENGLQSNITDLTPREKKAFNLWWGNRDEQHEIRSMKAEETETVDITQTSDEDADKLDMDLLQTNFKRVKNKCELAPAYNTRKKDIPQKSDEGTENSLRKKCVSGAQYDIFLKLLEEDKIFRIGTLVKGNREYIAEKWAELSDQLNNCICGPKLLIYEWKERFASWKNRLKRKSRNVKNGLQSNIPDLNPTEKKAFKLWWGNPQEKHEIRLMIAAQRSKNEEKVKLKKKPTPKQYDIYLKLLEEDEIFRKRRSPMESTEYIDEKWTELSIRLNKCYAGLKLSPIGWKRRLDISWKNFVRNKLKRVANSRVTGIKRLTAREKKAIGLWKWRKTKSFPVQDKKTEPESDKKKEKSLRKNYISGAQYDIFLKLLEEDKIFRIGMLLKENREHIAEKWAELSNQLNNCMCGPKLPINEWRQKFTSWKCYIKRKSRNLENGLQSNIPDLTPREKKGFNLWWGNRDEQHEIRSMRAALKKKKENKGKTALEQYAIYLKLLEEDKIFRIGIPPRENPQYITKKWEELSTRLNNCESGATLSPNLWEERLNKSWRLHIRRKCVDVAKGIQSGILVLTEEEKKAIYLWQKAEQDYNNEQENIKKTTFEQYAIYLKLLEEDKIFGTDIPPKGNPQYIAQKWEELSNRLNNCESGPKLSPNLWEKRIYKWKNDIKKKWRESANSILVLTEQEKKAIALWEEAAEESNKKKVEKCKERFNRLNNCESGVKLSPKLGIKRLNRKSRNMANGIKSGILVITEQEKKAVDLWQKVARQSKNEKVSSKIRKERITFEQFDIYLKLLEEDKIFRIGISPKENPQYIAEKWKELSNRLNNCESGGILSPTMWRKRLNSVWKTYVKKKWRKTTNGIQSGNLVLTEQEKKAIYLWQTAAQESRNEKGNIKKQKISPEQYDIYLKLLEEEKIFRKRIYSEETPHYIAEKGVELSKQLNNCKTGAKLSPRIWKERLDMDWKERIKTKIRKMAKSKTRNKFLTIREKRAIELLQINIGSRRRSPCFTKCSNDRNADTPSTDSSATNTAEMSPVTQAPMHEMVYQISQSHTPEPFTITLPAEPSTDIEEPTSTTVDDKTLVLLQTESPLESSIAIQPLEPPEGLSVFEKRTELSEPKKQRIDQSLIKLLMSDLQPISILENKGFLEYSYILQPLYKVPNQKLLSNHILTRYQETKQKILGILNQVSYVAVTTDMRTSESNRTFLALTSYFIFDNKLKSALLSVKEIPEMHTADSLAEAILTTLEEWAISTKVVAIITKNGANIKKAIESLKIDHLPCVMHTVNQCVTNAIKEASELSALLETCRSLVASGCLKEMQKQMGLPELEVNVDARWNSSLIMLNRLLELQQPLSAVISPFSNAPKFLNASEWDLIRDCASILRPLELMIKEFPAEKYLTMSCIIPLIRGLQSIITKEITITSCGSHFKTALLDLLRVLLEILEIHKFCAKATFLDPKFKHLGFGNEANAENVKKAIIDEISVKISKRNCTTSTKTGEERKINTSLWSFMREIASTTNVPSVSVNLSVEQYLNMEPIDISHDPLEFWNRNEKLLPELFQLSQKYLCIPASSVASERTFSMLGEIINETRNRLGGEKLNQIVFVDSNTEL